MARPKSRANSLLPSRITDAEVRGKTNLYGLDDAKAALGVEQEETFRDADLLIRIPHAQAYVERCTDLHLAPTQVKAQYENTKYINLVSLVIPASDVIREQDDYPLTVVEYPTEDSNGEVVPVEVDSVRGRTYLARTDGGCFPYGCDIVVEVNFYRGVQRGSQLADLVQVMMNEVIIEMNKINGVTAAVPPQLSATFIRNPVFMDYVRKAQNMAKMTMRIS